MDIHPVPISGRDKRKLDPPRILDPAGREREIHLPREAIQKQERSLQHSLGKAFSAPNGDSESSHRVRVDERSHDHDDVVQQLQRSPVDARLRAEQLVALEVLQYVLDVVLQLERSALADLLRHHLLEVVGAAAVAGATTEHPFEIVVTVAAIPASVATVVVGGVVVIVVPVRQPVLEVVEVFARDQVRVGLELGQKAGPAQHLLVVRLDAERARHKAHAPVERGRDQILQLVALVVRAEGGRDLVGRQLLHRVLLHPHDQVVQDEMDALEVLPQVDRYVQLHRDVVRPHDEVAQAVRDLRHVRVKQQIDLGRTEPEHRREPGAAFVLFDFAQRQYDIALVQIEPLGERVHQKHAVAAQPEKQHRELVHHLELRLRRTVRPGRIRRTAAAVERPATATVRSHRGQFSFHLFAEYPIATGQCTFRVLDVVAGGRVLAHHRHRLLVFVHRDMFCSIFLLLVLLLLLLVLVHRHETVDEDVRSSSLRSSTRHSPSPVASSSSTTKPSSYVRLCCCSVITTDGDCSSVVPPSTARFCCLSRGSRSCSASSSPSSPSPSWLSSLSSASGSATAARPRFRPRCLPVSNVSRLTVFSSSGLR
uniref:Uncharacterized protein n=1 Tax=Anopheles farauti TaxID=69004 RepID=A0A182QR31_9DIPT